MDVIRWRIAFSLYLSKYVLQHTNFSRAAGWDDKWLLGDGCWPSGQADFNLQNTAGTGLREFEKIIVGSKEEYERIQANRKNVLDFADETILEEK